MDGLNTSTKQPQRSYQRAKLHKLTTHTIFVVTNITSHTKQAKRGLEQAKISMFRKLCATHEKWLSQLDNNETLRSKGNPGLTFKNESAPDCKGKIQGLKTV